MHIMIHFTCSFSYHETLMHNLEDVVCKDFRIMQLNKEYVDGYDCGSALLVIQVCVCL